ncbi:MAG: DUF692 family multinuclear iron-containing protein [Chloroflexota bacterium]
MMQFAINWSPEAATLYDEGTIDFDMYKCSDWERLVEPAQKQRPSYVHFPLTIGRGQYPEWDFDDIYSWLDRTTTQFVNCHIVPDRAQFDSEISVRELAPLLAKEVQLLVDEFGAERVIIENCPYFAGNAFKNEKLQQGIEPYLLHHIVDVTDCGFLLDIAHAKMTCDFLGKDLDRYFASLPYNRIRELHVTGIGTRKNGTHGDHMPMTDADWQLLETCAEKIIAGKWATPAVMTFEYGGIEYLRDLCGSEREAIQRDVPRFMDITQRINATRSQAESA